MSYIKVETKSATYLINLEQHTKFFDSIPESQKLDAIAVELSIEMPPFINIYGANSRPAFTSTILEKNLQKRKTDVFFVDPGVNQEVANEEIKIAKRRIGIYQNSAELAKAMAIPGGAAALGRLIYNIATREKGKKISRRMLLKYGTIGALCASPFIFSEFLTSVVYKVPIQKGEVNAYRRLGLKFLDFVTKNRMFYTKSLRDAVIAERLEKLVAPMALKKAKGKPVIGVYMGADHGIDLERMLKNQELRAQYLKAAEGYIPERLHSGFYKPRFFHWNDVEKKIEGPEFFEKKSGEAKLTGKRPMELTEKFSRRNFFKFLRRRV